MISSGHEFTSRDASSVELFLSRHFDSAWLSTALPHRKDDVLPEYTVQFKLLSNYKFELSLKPICSKRLLRSCTWSWIRSETSRSNLNCFSFRATNTLRHAAKFGSKTALIFVSCELLSPLCRRQAITGSVSWHFYQNWTVLNAERLEKLFNVVEWTKTVTKLPVNDWQLTHAFSLRPDFHNDSQMYCYTGRFLTTIFKAT